MLNGLPLIDAHVHVARLPTLNMPWERWTFSSRRDGDIRALYDERGTAVPSRLDAFFESEGVDCALLLTEYSPRVTGIQPVEDILPLVEFNPKRMRLIANVNPHLHFPAEREAKRQLDLGAVALKIHPCHGNFAANDAELYRTYALCAERGVPVVFHCGTSNFPGAVNRYAGPELMEDVARSFPDLTIVLAHGGRGWWYEAAGFLTLMRENLWIEISGLPPQRLPQYFGRFDFERIAQRFIFGTDWPGAPGIRANAEAVAALALPRETLANVLAGNAVSVYRLAPV
jgi:predicted TIM-barrel fold metal-dependent hydrolase